jgi:hypothetical protein
MLLDCTAGLLDFAAGPPTKRTAAEDVLLFVGGDVLLCVGTGDSWAKFAVGTMGKNDDSTVSSLRLISSNARVRKRGER